MPLPVGAYFFGVVSEEPSPEGVRPTISAVAGKTRHRSKKAPAATRRAKKAGARRRTSPARGRARARAPVTSLRRKPEAEGATVGMTTKKTTQRQGFKTSEYIVYPAHGVGQIIAIEEQEVAGAKLELFVINFVKDKMTLRVPTAKAASVGMRKLAEGTLVKRALETLKGRARIKRTMWSRRAQEYEAKINSGDIVAIAEVVRDLFRSESQPSSPIRSGSSMRPRSIGCRARSRRCSASPRPRRSRRSKRLSPRARAADRPRPLTNWSRTRPLKRAPATIGYEARRSCRAFIFVCASCVCPLVCARALGA